jgi:hypothetical protein
LDDFKEYIEPESYVLRIEDMFLDKIVFTFYYTLHQLESDIEKTTRKHTIRKLVNFIKKNRAELEKPIIVT